MAAATGSLARTLDFGDSDPSLIPATATRTRVVTSGRQDVAAAGSHVLPWRGRDKYRLLEHRRRQAQIKARRLLAAAE